MLDLQAFPSYSLDAPQEELAYQVEQGSHQKRRNIGSLIMSITGWQRPERPMNLSVFLLVSKARNMSNTYRLRNVCVCVCV